MPYAMPKITLRPTVPADLPHAIGEPLPCRIRAITALADDRIIGMGGIAFPPEGPAIAFVQLVPLRPPEDGAVCGDDRTTASVAEAGASTIAQRYPVAFHRAGLMAMDMIRASEVRQVIATADARSAVAVRWLKRLGFRPADSQRIEGKLLFVWNREPGTDTMGRLPSGAKLRRP
jgi:hypothetical protein